MMEKAIAYILISLWIGGCTKQETIQPVSQASAVVGSWVLVSPASPYSLTITLQEVPAGLTEHFGLRLSGQSSVNRFFTSGLFSVRPTMDSGEAGTGSLHFPAATRMAGSPEAMRFEDDYFARLGSVNRMELTSRGRLRLSHTQPTPGVLIYQRQ